MKSDRSSTAARRRGARFSPHDSPIRPREPRSRLAHVNSHRLLLVVALITALNAGGCASYQIGNQSLYRPDIRTVYVPMFESESYRRNLGERLTEAVIKEIESKTPYKVVHTPNADSVLSGRIVTETKRVIAKDDNNQPRDKVAQLT